MYNKKNITIPSNTTGRTVIFALGVVIAVFVPAYLVFADVAGNGGSSGETYSLEDRDGDGVYATYIGGNQVTENYGDLNDSNAWIGGWNSTDFNIPNSGNYTSGGGCCTSSDGLY